MSNTLVKHIAKLTKSIDNKLFDLLVDIEDQINTNNYTHWKINHELRKIIMRKILLDKDIKLTPNKLGVYGYSHNEKIQFKEYKLTLGKGDDNLIYPMYAVFSFKDKVTTKQFNYNKDKIKKKIQYDLVNVFKSMKQDLISIHNNVIELNPHYYRYNNIKYIYPKLNIDNVNNYEGIKQYEFTDHPINKHTTYNDFMEDDLQQQIHNNKIIQRFVDNKIDDNYNNDEMHNINNNAHDNNNNQIVEYKFNKIEDDYMFDNDEDEDLETNIKSDHISKQISFYEDAMGIVSNSHKNKDRVKYLEKLKNKFIKKQQNMEQFQKYYKYAKKINENEF